MTTGQRLEEIRRLIARTETENRKQYRETVDELIRLIDESTANAKQADEKSLTRRLQAFRQLADRTLGREGKAIPASREALKKAH